MSLFLLAAIAIVLVMFSRTEAGEGLARSLARLSSGHLVLAAAMVALGLGLFLAFEGDGLRLFSFIAPELTAWFAMFDIALLVDVALVAVAVFATTRFRSLRDQAVLVAQRLVSRRRGGRSRSARTRVRRPAEPGADDPDPAWAVFAVVG
ncbi:hypothetical protein [Caulobacter sp. 17J80-11]|uniref:hypothetical protein n=1 Tax=Caulobacter sp. 17J80-11 TaxID=2763502 RepID=UPI0016536EC4|nr:hypothetical protein [Caulobacter sp. 17J80-11]MBC6981473.1 hypothetical protein [Caulobacter sp. 17J80-11]